MALRILHRGTTAALAFGAVLAASFSALASPTFPAELQNQLDMPCAPPCTVCHRDSNGGIGTAVQPFGAAMKNNGLELKRPDLIKRALQEIADESIDSDGDGVLDGDELREGRNPNQPGPGLLCATYGCGARVAPESTTAKHEASFAWLASVVVIAFLRMRREAHDRRRKL